MITTGYYIQQAIGTTGINPLILIVTMVFDLLWMTIVGAIVVGAIDAYTRDYENMMDS